MQQPVTSAPVKPDSSAPEEALKYDSSTLHPVQKIERDAASLDKQARLKMKAAVYGAALPMRLAMHEHMLAQCHRLPGLQSSFTSLESFTHRDETIDFDDFLNLPHDAPEIPREEPRDALERTLNIPSASTL